MKSDRTTLLSSGHAPAFAVRRHRSGTRRSVLLHRVPARTRRTVIVCAVFLGVLTNSGTAYAFKGLAAPVALTTTRAVAAAPVAAPAVTVLSTGAGAATSGAVVAVAAPLAVASAGFATGYAMGTALRKLFTGPTQPNSDLGTVAGPGFGPNNVPYTWQRIACNTAGAPNSLPVTATWSGMVNPVLNTGAGTNTYTAAVRVNPYNTDPQLRSNFGCVTASRVRVYTPDAAGNLTVATNVLSFGTDAGPAYTSNVTVVIPTNRPQKALFCFDGVSASASLTTYPAPSCTPTGQATTSGTVSTIWDPNRVPNNNPERSTRAERDCKRSDNSTYTVVGPMAMWNEVDLAANNGEYPPILIPACDNPILDKTTGLRVPQTIDTNLGTPLLTWTAPTIDATAFPECATKPCLMTLTRIAPDGSRENCTGTVACTGWNSAPPTNGETYECKFGPYIVPTSECTIVPTEPGTDDPGMDFECVGGFSFNPVDWVIEPLKCLFIPSQESVDSWQMQLSVIADTPPISSVRESIAFVRTTFELAQNDAGVIQDGDGPFDVQMILDNAGDAVETTTLGQTLYTLAQVAITAGFVFYWYNRITASAGSKADI